MSTLGSDGESVTSQSLKEEQLSADLGDDDSRSEASSQDTDNLDNEAVTLRSQQHATARPQSLMAMDQVIQDIAKSGSRPMSLQTEMRSSSPNLSDGNQGSRSSSTLSSPASVKHDLVTELKKMAPAPGLRKTKKPSENGQMTCIYSFGGADNVKPRPKPVQNDPDEVTTRTDVVSHPRPVSDIPKHVAPPVTVMMNGPVQVLPSSPKNRPLSTGNLSKVIEEKKTDLPMDGDFSPKNFEDQVPRTDKSGNPLPAWRRQLLARQMAEKVKQEAEERKKIEEVEARFKGMPVWKRQLIEKKEADAKSHEKSSSRGEGDRKSKGTAVIQGLN